MGIISECKEGGWLPKKGTPVYIINPLIHNVETFRGFVEYALVKSRHGGIIGLFEKCDARSPGLWYIQHEDDKQVAVYEITELFDVDDIIATTEYRMLKFTNIEHPRPKFNLDL